MDALHSLERRSITRSSLTQAVNDARLGLDPRCQSSVASHSPLAAVAALYAFSPRTAGQAAQADPAAQIQMANEFFESARYQEALDAYNLAIQSTDPALVTRARKGKVRIALRVGGIRSRTGRGGDAERGCWRRCRGADALGRRVVGKRSFR